MKITIDTHHSSREEVAELKEYLEQNCWDFKDDQEDEKSVNYILREDGIHIVGSHMEVLNEKIRDEDLHEYRIVHRESLIEDLYSWIGEGNNQAQLMKDDLRMLEQLKDDYIFSSVSTNDYISSESSNFDETCEELLKINEGLKKD